MRNFLKQLRDLYDWVHFGDAALSALQTKSGYAVTGSLVAMLIGAWTRASWYEIILMGLAVFIVILLYSINQILKQSKPAFELLYEPNDLRFVRSRETHTKYYIGLHVLSEKSIDNPNVRALEGRFANEVLAIAHGARSWGNVPIYSGGRLDPDDLEIFELVGLPNHDHLPTEADNVLVQSSRFTLEARGAHSRVARAEFEYDPEQIPMIRRLK
jgi:hypothetical protein